MCYEHSIQNASFKETIMKNIMIKSTLFTALSMALALTISSSAFACPDGGRKHDGHKQRVAKELNLTEEQRQKFEELMRSRGERMELAMKKVQKGITSELAEFLTPEQLQILEENKPPRRKMMKQRQHAKK